MHNWRSRAAAAVAVPVLLTVAACGGGGEEGSIAVDGSSTVGPLTQAAAELFGEENSDVKVSVGTAGTGGGFEKFCAGETDISDASRPIKDEEIAACKAGGVEYAELQVANDALTVLVHKDNPIDCLTVEQLQSIWEPNSKIKTWDQVKGAKGDKEEIKLYSPGSDSGTFEYFTEEIVGEKGVQRSDAAVSDIGENDNLGIKGVTDSKGGIFYVGFSYFEENQDSVKALQIDAGDGCVTPSVETTQDGSYKPLGRPLFIYPSKKAMDKSYVKSFVDYFLENYQQIAEDAQYIPMTEEQASASKAALGS